MRDRVRTFFDKPPAPNQGRFMFSIFFGILLAQIMSDDPGIGEAILLNAGGIVIVAAAIVGIDRLRGKPNWMKNQ